MSLSLAAIAAVPLHAQAADDPSAATPALRRWFDIETFTISSRYRFTDSSKNVTTTDQLQYKDTFRARISADAAKRFSVVFGYYSGNSFIGSWDNLGVGHDTVFDGKDHYVKQLYAAVAPIKGVELQFGGLFFNRGEGDEWLTFDDDGFLEGERATIRHPEKTFLDEITLTYGAIGPSSAPNIGSRVDLLAHPDYLQILGVKRMSDRVAGSLEYNRQSGADIVRAAATIHFERNTPVSTVRYEQYVRLNQSHAAGFGLWAERPITSHLRVQGGYVTVDQFYGGWNADRMQSGRRFFLSANVPIHGPLSASVYTTRALSAPYAVAIHRRVDVVLTYDVRASLRRSGVF